MSATSIEQIARAVLYEGYLLYPYRQSALKNQQRWNFGVLYPPSWAAAQTGSDRAYLQMECLALAAPETTVDISLRFLQLVKRESASHEWQEAIERQITIPGLKLANLTSTHRFSFEGGHEEIDGIRRARVPLEARVEISAAPVRDGVQRLTVRVTNTTVSSPANRNQALLASLASAHVVAGIRGGEFASQIDPPDELKDPASACQNVGVWPVLVGEQPARRTMLASPIILYDYPEIAPESGGDLFDGTEIDEILTLRVLTLTDAEKDELRRSDDRARRLLERLESSPQDHLLQLHGTIRGMRESQSDAWSAWDTLESSPPASAVVSGTGLKKGDRVRLRPRKRADVFDTLLAGRVAVIEAIEEDFERHIHVAVVLEDDPGRDFGEMRQAGHRFFYGLDELEPMEPSHE